MYRKRKSRKNTDELRAYLVSKQTYENSIFNTIRASLLNDYNNLTTIYPGWNCVNKSANITVTSCRQICSINSNAPKQDT